ncbi:hypothetical protein J2X71_007289 [Rhizobium sp. 1399]|nr:hypothetical protein [Rhizobium sp. 1399]
MSDQFRLTETQLKRIESLYKDNSIRASRIADIR